jgi:hypothetical protein
MEATLVGMLIGRLLMSYFVVWFSFFVFSRLDIRQTFKRVHTLAGMSILSVVFLVPYFASLGRAL